MKGEMLTTRPPLRRAHVPGWRHGPGLDRISSSLTISALMLENLNYIRRATGRILDGIFENQTLPEVRAVQIRRHRGLTSSVEFGAE